MKLHMFKPLRFFVMLLLKKLDKDITIKHHWTRDNLLLSLFKHKGYWYHGKKRELLEMKMIEKVVLSGDIVAEVGGHIGYLSLWFAYLAKMGKVFVFEPGYNNLPYIRKNVGKKSNISLIELAVGDEAGQATFYEESLTGQNNSFLKDFDGLKVNAGFSSQSSTTVERLVNVVRLDDYFKENGKWPTFIKIDVEGFELNVLKGCEGIFISGFYPKFMVELQTNEEEILDLFRKFGYKIYRSDCIEIQKKEDFDKTPINLFFLHPKFHQIEIKSFCE